ncbi:MAG: BCCT family transporter, partial [Lachnospiraceae bacterium]|nr:BCCT family transporter [Lachnospiraceae bacterium]
MKKFNVEKAIFWPSVIVLFGMILYGFVFNDSFNKLMTFLFGLVTSWTGWFMCIVSMALIFICVVVCFTPLGKKKVGGPDAKVE